MSNSGATENGHVAPENGHMGKDDHPIIQIGIRSRQHFQTPKSQPIIHMAMNQ